MQEQDPQPRPEDWRTGGARVSLHEEAQLVDRDGTVHKVKLVDVSRTGFRLVCDDRLVLLGPATLLNARYGDTLVELRWIRGDSAGGVFLSEAPTIV